MQVVDQTWICVVNVVTTVGKLSIKRIQQKVSYRWISRETERIVSFSYTLLQPILIISFINLALNGEKIRPKKKDLPPNSSSKARQGQGRKKVIFNLNFISIYFSCLYEILPEIPFKLLTKLLRRKMDYQYQNTQYKLNNEKWSFEWRHMELHLLLRI